MIQLKQKKVAGLLEREFQSSVKGRAEHKHKVTLAILQTVERCLRIIGVNKYKWSNMWITSGLF